MINTKIGKIYDGLTKVELRNFTKFLRGLEGKNAKKVIELHRVLEKSYPKIHLLSIEKCYTKVFKSKEFNEKTFRYLMTDLTRAFEDFIVDYKINQNPILRSQILADFYRTKELDKYSSTFSVKIHDILESNAHRDDNYFEKQYHLQKLKYNLIDNKRSSEAREALQDVGDFLDTSYIINKLKLSCEIINHTSVFSGEFKPTFLNRLITFIEKDLTSMAPIVQVYYWIYRTLVNEEEEAYQNLRKLLKIHSNLISDEELRDMYIFARNFCAKQINKGHDKYLQENLDLFKVLLSHNLLIQNNILSEWDFKNIIYLGLRLQEFEWTEEFIEEYKDKLLPELRENAVRYNTANLEFAKGNFNNTIELLRDVELTDPNYQINSRLLLLKTYYSMQEFELLHSLMDTVHVYLRRNKIISTYKKQVTQNFMKYLKKMVRARFKEESQIIKLKNDLLTAENIADHTWLKEEFEKISSSH